MKARHGKPRGAADADGQDPIQRAFRNALAFHQKGQVERAQAALEEILKSDPKHHGALNLSGLIAHQGGDAALAVELLNSAVETNPAAPDSHNNLGNALRTAGRPAAAVESFDRAIALGPEIAELHHNLGNALRDLNRLQDAVASYDRAIALRPDYVSAYNNRGNALASLEQFQEALESYDRAIELRPDYAMAFNNRGNVLLSLKQPEAALESFDRAIALNRAFAMAHNNRGNALLALDRLDGAIESFDRAIALQPTLAEAHNNLGRALLSLQSPREALAKFERALELKPDHAKAVCNRGNAFRALNQLEAAVECYDRAIEMKPDDALFIVNKALAKLLSGSFEEGWKLYEWRRQTEEMGEPRRYEEPVWTGAEDIRGKTLFVHWEQGLGDTIQFSRYARLAESRGAKVVFSVQDKLVRLMKTLSPTITVVGSTQRPRTFDYHISLLSLPLAFGTSERDIPADVPYLFAEPDNVKAWARRLGDDGFKIGISWQGNPRSKVDAGRSVGLGSFAVFSGLPNVRLISLQVMDGVEQLQQLPAGMRVETLGHGFDEGPDGFIDAAAVIANLDLVITIDTSIAHLAGALGRPAWVALKYSPDWRWLLGRSDSPWYPTLRLFRQELAGDWPRLFADMRRALGERLAGHAEKAALAEALKT